MVAVFDETESDIRRLIEADFGPLSSVAKVHDDLLDWLHYRARRIPSRLRKVVVSAEVQAAVSQYSTIRQIAQTLRNGGDVSPWLSDSVRKKKKNHKADMMFNDWKISHFHLSRVWNTPHSRNRSAALLYALVTADVAVLLDVGPHGRWTAKQLLEILARTYPGGLEYELKGMTPDRLSDQQRANLRANGYTTMVELNGRAFMAPGMGLATSGHSLRFTMYLDHLYRNIKHLKAIIPRNQLTPAISRVIHSNLTLPVRLGVRLNDGGLMVLDKSRALPLYTMKCLE
jgi:hypothetical protein